MEKNIAKTWFYAMQHSDAEGNSFDPIYKVISTNQSKSIKQYDKEEELFYTNNNNNNLEELACTLTIHEMSLKPKEIHIFKNKVPENYTDLHLTGNPIIKRSLNEEELIGLQKQINKNYRNCWEKVFDNPWNKKSNQRS